MPADSDHVLLLDIRHRLRRLEKVVTRLVTLVEPTPTSEEAPSPEEAQAATEEVS